MSGTNGPWAITCLYPCSSGGHRLSVLVIILKTNKKEMKENYKLIRDKAQLLACVHRCFLKRGMPYSCDGVSEILTHTVLIFIASS